MPAYGCSKHSYKLHIFITKNMNLRIELRRCFDSVEDFPISTILPYVRAKKIMTDCGFDIEELSRLISVHND